MQQTETARASQTYAQGCPIVQSPAFIFVLKKQTDSSNSLAFRSSCQLKARNSTSYKNQSLKPDYALKYPFVYLYVDRMYFF